MSSASSPHIFLTGVTGYIGGTVFTHLHKAFPSAKFTLLVRPSSSNASIVEKLKGFSNVKVEQGNNQDANLVPRLIQAADVVVHTAESADDMEAAKVITSALSDGSKRRLYIHTSGSAVVCFGKSDARGEYATPDSEIWTDLDFNRYNSIPDDAPHRTIDKVVIQAAQANPNADVIIVTPPTIYGKGTGPGNQLSQQIPLVIKMTLASGHPGTVGKGLNKWNSVHIEDLAELYVAIVKKGLEKKISFIAGGGGLYFTATGEFQWGDVQRAVGAELVKRGLVKDEFRQWTTQEAEEYGSKFVWMAIGSNSRYRSERAEKEGLGWKPKHVNAVLSTIPSDVDEVLKRQKAQE
jgi:nucleoside-diphosphate-sugar epimerase